MARNMFDVHIIVPAKMVGTIVELLNGEGLLVSVSQKQQQQADETNCASASKYVGGKRRKSVNSYLLAVWCTNAQLSEKQTDALFHKYKHARSSSGFCYAKKLGYINQDGVVTSAGNKALDAILCADGSLPPPQ